MTNERYAEVIQAIKFILPDKYYNEKTEEALDMAIKALEQEPLTDKEQRIFLAAMGREEKICREVDDKYPDKEPYEDSLVSVCRSIERKVRKALWDLGKSIKALVQEPCEDEYIKVPKKALKYRTAGMVAYNAEWLKNNFDIERAVICGAQQPILDKIRAEIEQLPITDTAIKLVAEILDKYKAESEEV